MGVSNHEKEVVIKHKSDLNDIDFGPENERLIEERYGHAEKMWLSLKFEFLFIIGIVVLYILAALSGGGIDKSSSAKKADSNNDSLSKTQN